MSGFVEKVGMCTCCMTEWLAHPVKVWLYHVVRVRLACDLPEWSDLHVLCAGPSYLRVIVALVLPPACTAPPPNKTDQPTRSNTAAAVLGYGT